MADFSGQFGDFTEEERAAQAAQPVNPIGLDQLVQGWNPEERAANPFGPQNYVEASKEWFGGRNVPAFGAEDANGNPIDGTVNGWSTPFVNELIAQQDLYLREAAAAQDQRVYFDWVNRPDATGLVTWNDEAKGLRAGDVFVRGVKQQNLFDTYKEQPGTADLLFSNFIFDGDQEARVNRAGGFGDGGSEVRRDRVQRFIDDTTAAAAGSESAGAFKDRVEAKKQEYSSEGFGVFGDESTAGSTLAGAGAGAVTGATAGAVAGSILPGPGTVIGGVVGGLAGTLIGGVGGWLNRDEITEAAARGAVQAEMAGETEGRVAGVSAAVQGAAGTAMLAGQPLANITKGVTVEAGTRGDGVTDLYAIDPLTGQRKTSGWQESAILTATLGDSFLQFFSPGGRALYMGTMGAYTGGKLTTTVVSDATFNEETGAWDTLEGAKEYFGAYGSIGIDAVQMGMVGATIGRTKSIQKAAGLRGADDADVVTAAWKMLPGTPRAGSVADAGTTKASEVVSGMRVWFDDAGKVVAARPSLQMLAPSEMFRSVVVGQQARRAALRAADGGAASWDDFYRAHLRLAYGPSKWQNALATGFAEAIEEGAQALLDPMSYGGDFNGMQAVKAAAYGFASGAGMALGAQAHMGYGKDARGLKDQQLIIRQLARQNTEIRNGAPLSDEEWEEQSKGWSEEMFLMQAMRDQAMRDQEELKDLQAVNATAVEVQRYVTGVFNPLGVSIEDGVSPESQGIATEGPAAFEQVKLFGAPLEYDFALDGTIIGFKPGVAPDEMAFSWGQLALRLKRKLGMMEAHAKDAQARIVTLREDIAAATEAGDTDAVAQLTQRIDQVEIDLADQQELADVIEIISNEVRALELEFHNEPDLNTRSNMVDTINAALRRAVVEGKWTLRDGGNLQVRDPELITRAVEQMWGREPLQDQGSALRFIPRVSLEMTVGNAHGRGAVHQTMLKIVNGDHDGDAMEDLSGVYLPHASRRAARLGRSFIVGEGVDMKLRMDPPDSEVQNLNQVRRMWNGPTEHLEFVYDETTEFVAWFKTRYDGVFPPDVVDSLIDAFVEEFIDGNPEARSNLILAMARQDITALVMRGEQDGRQEIPNLSNQITLLVEKIKRKYALLEYQPRRDAQVPEPAQVARGARVSHDAAVEEAATSGAMLSLIYGPDATRASQKPHYNTFLRAAVSDSATGEGGGQSAGFVPVQAVDLARAHMLVSSGEVDSAQEKIDRRDIVTDRALAWLRETVDAAYASINVTPTEQERAGMMLVFAQLEMPDYNITYDGGYTEESQGRITLAQSFLRTSVQMERKRYEQVPNSDEMKRLNALDGLTRPQEAHSYSASSAFLEIFGSMRLKDLFGDFHASLGPNATVGQFVQELQSKDSFHRKELLRVFRGLGYLHHDLGDPPYKLRGPEGVIDAMRAGTLNGYTIFVDTLKAVSGTNYKAMKSRNDSVTDQVRRAFQSLGTMIDQWELRFRDQLVFPEGASAQERRQIILLDMMRNDRRLPDLLAGLFPLESRLSTFAKDATTGEVSAKAWVMEALTMTDYDAAMVVYYVNTQLDQYSQLGAQIEREDRIKQAENPDAKIEAEGVSFGRIKSRFLQRLHTAYMLQDQDGGASLDQLWLAMGTAKNLDELQDAFNDNPALGNGREKLLLWYDNVSDFESVPIDMFGGAMPGAVMRERYTKIANRLQKLSGTMLDERAAAVKAKAAIDAMQERYYQLGGTDAAVAELSTKDRSMQEVDKHLTWLIRAIEHRRNIPDIKGMNVYDQAFQAAQRALIAMQDKGKSTDELKNVGTASFANTTWGWRTGLEHNADSITAVHWQQVLANLSKLTEGPVRIQFDDGSMSPVVDFSNAGGVLEALANPATQMFARAVLLPTGLDIDTNNNLQLISQIEKPLDFVEMLKQDDFAHLTGIGDTSTQEAYTFFGLVESAMQGQSLDGSEAERAAATHKLHHLANDFITVYMHSADRKTRGDAKTRHRLLTNLMDALQRIAWVEDPVLQRELLDGLKAELQARAHGRNEFEEFKRDEPVLYDYMMGQLEDLAQEQLQDQLDELQARMDVLQPTSPEYDQLRQRRIDLIAASKDSAERIIDALAPSSSAITPETALRRFAIDYTDEESMAASIDNVLDYLGSGDVLSRMLGKDTSGVVEQAILMISQRATTGLDPNEVENTDWNMLTAIAATELVAQSLSPTGSWVGLSMLDDYYDYTFSYLVDAMFDPQLLSAVRYVTAPAKQRFETMGDTVAATKQYLLDGLLHADRLGEWTTRIPVESAKLRKAVDGSEVGAALSTAGSLPSQLGPYSDASVVTFTLPEEHHHSVFEYDGRAGADILATLYETDTTTRKNRVSDLVKLEHHFVREVRIESAELGGFFDLTEWATLAPYLEDEVLNSGYRVLTFAQLQAAVDRFIAANPAIKTYSLTIEYVDVDKKPATQEYATSVFFEGVGREFEANAMLSPINSMLFASGGLNQKLQDIPLQFMKSGSAYFAFRPAPFARLLEMEAEADTLAEMMHLKAMHLLYAKYEHGRLQYADLPALHKMMKLRHLAQADDGTILWVEQAIALQEAAIASGEQMPTFKLIPLSDPIAKRLFQLAEADRQARPGLGHGYPKLDAETLRRLGLEGLGTQRTLEQSPFMAVGLPQAGYLSDRKGAPIRDAGEKPLQVQHSSLVSEEFARRLLRTTGDYTPRRITERNDATLLDSVNIEAVIPYATSQLQQALHRGTIAEDVQSQWLATKIDDMKPNVLNMTYLLTGDIKMAGTSGIATGYVTPFDVQRGFEDTASEGAAVVPGDVMLIDLVSIYESLADRNNADAMAYLRTAVLKLQKAGVSFVLISKDGSSRQLRAELAEFINTLPGYRSVGGNSMFFSPITERSYRGATLQAERSTVTNTFSMTAEAVDFRVISDDQALNESSEMIYLDRIRTQSRHLNVLIPTQFTVTSPDLDPLAPSGDTYAFGLAHEGARSAEQYERLSKTLRALIASPEGRKQLTEQASGGKGSPDPEGYEYYEKYADGTWTDGVRRFDDALDVLLDHLYPSPQLVGRTLIPGDLIPVVDNRGNLILLRYGFDFPAATFQKQFADTRAQMALEDAAGFPLDFTIAVAGPSVTNMQTTYTPFKITEAKADTDGFMVKGFYEITKGSKTTALDEGLKTAGFAAPSHIKPVELPMSRKRGNAITITGEIGRASQVNKDGTRSIVNNMRNAFATFGIGFQDPLRRFFFGDATELSPEQQDDVIKDFLREWSFANIKMTEDSFHTLVTDRQLYESIRMELEPMLSVFFPTLSYDFLIDAERGVSEDVPARITTLLMGTLAMPGVTYEDVIGSLGLLNSETQTSGERIKFMPSVFTEALNDRNFPATRTWLFEQMDRNIRRADDGTRVYILDEDFNFFYLVTDAEGNNPVYRKGLLTFGKYENTEESSDVNAHAQAVRGPKQRVTPHQMHVLNKITNGGRTPYNPERLKAEGIVIEDFATEWLTRPHLQAVAEVSPMQGLLPKIKRLDETFNNYLSRTYLEQRIMDRASARLDLYLQPVARTDEKGAPWDETELGGYAGEILRKLNMDTLPQAETRPMLDLLVRQFLGAPGPSADQGADFKPITAQQYKEALSLIWENVKEGYNPLHTGAVPLPHAQLFLKKVFDAQLGAANPWAPVGTSSEESGDIAVADWADWVSAIIGQARSSRADFESMFSSDLNGFWQSYTGVSLSTMSLKLTPNDLVNAKLASPNKEEGFADIGARWDEISLELAMNPDEAALMRSPIILESMDITINTMLGKDEVFNGKDAPQVLASATRDKRTSQRGWRARKRLAQSGDSTMANFVEEGRSITHPMEKGTVLGRNLMNLSIINRLFNPAIWVSGLIEVPVLAGIQNVSDILTGQYLGLGGETLAAAGEKVGLKPRHSAEETKRLKALARQIAEDPAWRTEVMRELDYRVEVAKSDPRTNSRITKTLENGAAWAARVFSDPRQGGRAHIYAQQYLQGVLDYMHQTNNNIIGVDQLIVLLKQDPLAIKKALRDDGLRAHEMGLNHMSQIRGTKPTLVGQGIMLPIHWMIARDSAAVSFVGQLLQIPFAFTSFNVGRLMTLTGMQGWDQLAATFFDGRQKTPAVLRKGKPGATFDNSEIIETLDLQNTFIRSGATLTMLMALGLQAGRLGLGGESEEEERRRRLAKYLNVPHLRDPREPSNSFLFADAIFLENIPFLNNMFQNDAGNYAVVPHWIIRQFSSPVIGMSRFFETGDVREIRYGFEDAYSALPNSVETIIFQGDQLAQQLALEAQRQAAIASGAPLEDLSPTQQTARERFMALTVSIVGVLERALIENQFVNNLYTGLDQVDRNAFQYAATNDEATSGLDLTQGTNLPQRSDARTAVVNPDGETFTPYLTRTGQDGALHNYTKSNFTASVLASLFNGQGLSGSYNRYNMVPKEVKIDRPALSTDQAKALIHGAYYGSGGRFELTEVEIVRVLKAQWEATTDERWDQAELEARAKVIYDAHNGSNALTEITKDGVEAFTQAGNSGIIRGLFKGAVQLGDPALQGFALTQEQRDAIKVEMLTEIKQDAINLGLGTEAANYVMYRVWNGDDTQGVVGLKDIIYSDEIPRSNTLTYTQLNATYALGPDGRPWATPFTRQQALGALGVPVPQQMFDAQPGMRLDKLGNSIDEVTGINTGLAALRRKPEPELDIEDPDELTDQVAAKILTPDKDPYVNRKKYGGGYGGGGGSSFARQLWSRMDDIPDGQAPRAENVPFINTNSPYVRRSRINRERVFSDRGRLNEWQ